MSATTVDEFAGRLFESVLGAMDMWSIYLGEQLGFYDAMAAGDPITKDELADATGADARYTCEWLE